MAQDESHKLHIDEDWKQKAQAEKERLAAQAEAREQSKGGQSGSQGQQLPEASMRSLIGLLASQALMGLGTMQDPNSQDVMVDLEGAKFNIDLLAVLEEKTEGNLEDDEKKELTQVVSELRNRYVQISQLVAQQGSSGQVAPAQQQEQPESEGGASGRILTPDTIGSVGKDQPGPQNPSGG